MALGVGCKWELKYVQESGAYSPRNESSEVFQAGNTIGNQSCKKNTSIEFGVG